MNKNAIQKYAVWARNELIEQVKQRAYEYGITAEGYGDKNAQVINGRVLSPEEQHQRADFVVEVRRRGYQLAVEEVAYTWFNRFIALRFMEVNDYLPTHIRVFSDASGGFNPEILKDVLHLELPGLKQAKVAELLNANKTEELYHYLLLTQCNALSSALPEMFEPMGSYTEMLLPNNILGQSGVLGRLVTDIPEDDWRDAVQIIGWMYQYYNTEPKQAVFDGLKKNVKISKDKIPAATQLFTPDWIVRYMVENSLGRLWLESHPNDKLRAGWKYYLDEAEQEPEVAEKLRVLRAQSPVRSPEDIRLIDPCMGSGHILVYAFDVLMQIYRECGYSERDAAKLILEENIYGLDIDRRAYQLAYFALMMKARQYNRRILNEDVKPQVYHPQGWADGEEYGSLAIIDALPSEPRKFLSDGVTYNPLYKDELRVWNFKRLLAQKYDVVVTNPPYMGSSGMGGKLVQFVKDYYPDGKSDLYAVFVEKCGELTKTNGFRTMITQHSWMFLSSFERLRLKLLRVDTVNMAHLGARAFEEIGGEVVQTTSFVIRNSHVSGYKGVYCRLVEPNTQQGKEDMFLAGANRYIAQQQNLEKIPGAPVAYWLSDKLIACFGNTALSEMSISDGQTKTGNNDKYLRLLWEVDCNKVGSVNKWAIHAKGGTFRRWYGNIDTLIDWSIHAREHYRKDHVARIAPEYIWFRKGLSWTLISSSEKFAVRVLDENATFNLAAPSVFMKNVELTEYVIGFLNSPVAEKIMRSLNPTINTNIGDVTALPIIIEKCDEVSRIVQENISLSRADWDSFETSWDFEVHPLIYLALQRSHWNTDSVTVEECFKAWKRKCDDRFNQLKANEEELNRIFIDIYGLQDELTPEVENKDVTVRRADLGRDIRSLISYAVGCMFGRYDIGKWGLRFAGGDWNTFYRENYEPHARNSDSFQIDKDGILPICDDDYFDDDIVGRFVDFVRIAFGDADLEENLRFIAGALGGKGTPREVIRSYFLNDFYADHCRIYQKRPIYWLFDSGKKNGFKALVYMHRYSRDLLAKLRTDYVHEQQERYRTQLAHTALALETAAGTERVRLLKQQEKLTEQAKEIAAYEEKIHHLADQMIDIDLDDGVKVNYAKFEDVLAKLK